MERLQLPVSSEGEERALSITAIVCVSFATILAASRLELSRWPSTSVGTAEDDDTLPIKQDIRSRVLRSPSCRTKLSTCQLWI